MKFIMSLDMTIYSMQLKKCKITTSKSLLVQFFFLYIYAYLNICGFCPDLLSKHYLVSMNICCIKMEKVENRSQFSCRYQSHPDQALTGVPENGRAVKAGPH